MDCGFAPLLLAGGMLRTLVEAIDKWRHLSLIRRFDH
jgi:hypothetical protein